MKNCTSRLIPFGKFVNMLFSHGAERVNRMILSGAKIAKIYRVTGGANTIDIQTEKIGSVLTGERAES